MIPWLVLLAIELPASTVAVHWSTAWVALDAMETIGLLARARCCCGGTIGAAWLPRSPRR
jgi:hypothetical protein